MKHRGQFKSIVSKSHDLLKEEEEEGEKEGVFNLYTLDTLYFPIQVSHVQILITSKNIFFLSCICALIFLNLFSF